MGESANAATVGVPFARKDSSHTKGKSKIHSTTETTRRFGRQGKTHITSETTERPAILRRARLTPASSRSERFRPVLHLRRASSRAIAGFCRCFSHSAVQLHGFRAAARFPDRNKLLPSPSLLLPTTRFLVTGTRVANVDCPVCFHILVAQLFPLRSLETLVDGLADCVPLLIYQRWTSSAVSHIRGANEGAQHTFFTSSKCQFFHPFAAAACGKSSLLKLDPTTWSATKNFSRSPILTASCDESSELIHHLQSA